MTPEEKFYRQYYELRGSEFKNLASGDLKMIELMKEWGKKVALSSTKEFIDERDVSKDLQDTIKLYSQDYRDLKSKLEVAEKALKEIKEFQMNFVQLARTSKLYKIADKALEQLSSNTITDEK